MYSMKNIDGEESNTANEFKMNFMNLKTLYLIKK